MGITHDWSLRFWQICTWFGPPPVLGKSAGKLSEPFMRAKKKRINSPRSATWTNGVTLQNSWPQLFPTCIPMVGSILYCTYLTISISTLLPSHNFAGITHRDIKLENIRIDLEREHKIKLLDSGLLSRNEGTGHVSRKALRISILCFVNAKCSLKALSCSGDHRWKDGEPS